MSHHIKGQSRTQATLFPEALDDFVTDENPVRVIDAFVDSVDLALLGFKKSKPKQQAAHVTIQERCSNSIFMVI